MSATRHRRRATVDFTHGRPEHSQPPGVKDASTTSGGRDARAVDDRPCWRPNRNVDAPSAGARGEADYPVYYLTYRGAPLRGTGAPEWKPGPRTLLAAIPGRPATALVAVTPISI